MLQLKFSDAEGRRSVAVEAGPFSIGRGADNNLQLADAQVSRRHAELIQPTHEGVWRIRDCGSRFGTFVNDLRVEESDLKAGDRVRIGQTELHVESHTQATVTSSSMVSYDFRQVNALLAGLRALGSGKVLDEVLAIVLDGALEITGAERGFILLADENSKLALRLARARGGVTLTTAQTSQRIPEEVFTTGTDRIVTDLLDTAHATQHAGTVALGIRHVLCTPLKVSQYGAGDERRIGVLYLDSRERGYLDAAGALHALAAEAAVVIENARLYQEVVEKERAAQELRVAARIQQALLPPPYHLEPYVELAAASTPCRAVGGDLYDYATRADNSLSFAVADVAGKGTSAALLNAVVQGLFAAEAETTAGPAEILTRVNRALCRRAVASRFVTAFYGTLSPDGLLRYCNAGHNAPFLMSNGQATRLETGGTVLGLFDVSPFETGEARMGPNDVLVVFSDGVTEAVNPTGEEFGDDRLNESLVRSVTQSATNVLDTVQKTMTEFCSTAPAADDATILVLKMR